MERCCQLWNISLDVLDKHYCEAIDMTEQDRVKSPFTVCLHKLQTCNHPWNINIFHELCALQAPPRRLPSPGPLSRPPELQLPEPKLATLMKCLASQLSGLAVSAENPS